MTHRIGHDPEPPAWRDLPGPQAFMSLMRGVRRAADWGARNTLGRALALGTLDPQRPETHEIVRRHMAPVADFMPGLGDVKAAFYDAPQLFEEGHPIWGTVAAASAVPGPASFAFDVARKLGPAVRTTDEGRRIIRARHYGLGAGEDVLRTDKTGTGRPGSERANPDRAGRVYVYAPEVVEANTGRPFQPEVQFRGDPYVDFDLDISGYAGLEDYDLAVREAREVLRAEKAAGPYPNINPEPSPAAVENRAEAILRERGARGIAAEDRGVFASFEDIPLPYGATGRGVPSVARHARQYVEGARGAGRQMDPHPESFEYAPVSSERGQQIADVYDALPHDPQNPQVAASYQAMADETRDQYNFLTERGVKFEPAVDDPYSSSADMIADVRDNKRLKFFLTDLDDFPADHPLAAPSGVYIDMPDGTRREMVYNDLFRAVHDYFGHAAEGFQFGPRGEDNAWRLHASMFSPEARPAMSFETRGQNSWVNFGPQMRGADGRLLERGDEGYLSPQERSFADQKANILPDEFTDVGDGPSRTAVMEENFPMEAFHGTFDPIDEIDLARGDLGFHVGTSSQATNRIADVANLRAGFDPEFDRYSRAFDERLAGRPEMTGAQVMPLRVNPGKSLRMPDVGVWQDPETVAYSLRLMPEFQDVDLDGIIRNAKTDKEALDGLREAIQNKGYDSIVYKNMAENEGGGRTAMTPAAQQEWNEILAGREAGEIPTREAEERMMAIYQDDASYQSPDSYIMLDPKDVRSRSAAFDPAAIGQAGLMRSAVPVAGYFGVQSARDRLREKRERLNRRR
jgi:hypothetical protein